MQSDANGQSVGCTLEDYAEAKKIPIPFLKGLGLGDWKRGAVPSVRIPYYGLNGEQIGTRVRTALSGPDKFRWRAGDKANLYGLSRLQSYPSDFVVLVEGESDCHTLWHNDIPAIGIPGAGTWREDRDAKHFKVFQKIFVVIEPDQGGRTVQKWLSRSSIRERAHFVTFDGFKDPSGLYLDDPDQFRERFESALNAAVPWTTIEGEIKKTTVDGAWAACRELAESGDILAKYSRALSGCGVAGEERTGKLIYLALVSRFLDRPISIAIKGPSAGGKSFLCEQVLKFFPNSAYHALTGMSERALVYSEESLKHRFLVLFEAAGSSGDFASYLMRSLLSEGRIRYEVVEKTQEGMRPRLIEREGPTGLLVTTTAAALHPENETRLLSLTVTDTPDQTKRVLHELANGSNGNGVDLEPWHSLQVWLESAEHRVTIPFAGTLADLIPPIAVRLRRDFKLLLNLIKAHAILHQTSRERAPDGSIVATLDDYRVVADLVRDFIGECLETTVSQAVRETVEAVNTICDTKDHASVKELAAALSIDMSAAWRRARVAVAKGFLQNLEEKKGRPARLTPGDPLPENMEILPTIARLQAVANGDVIGETTQTDLNSGTYKMDCTIAFDSGGIRGDVRLDDDTRTNKRDVAALAREARLRARESLRSHGFQPNDGKRENRIEATKE
jgi:hypothetical protein